jgi:hypothetical protein
MIQRQWLTNSRLAVRPENAEITPMPPAASVGNIPGTAPGVPASV